MIATAIKYIYPPGWKCGQTPGKVVLGKVDAPEGTAIEDVAEKVKRAYPGANWFRLVGSDGHWICYGSI